MTIYKLNSESDELTRLKHSNFKDFYNEENLEKWVEKNPFVLIDDENILFIGRQKSTDLGPILDLIGLDADGNLVIVELKRDMTPREVIAQALEYASWSSRLTADEILRMGNEYVSENSGYPSLESAFNDVFGFGEVEADSKPFDNIVLNRKQRVIIVGEVISKKVEAVARYLNKVGMDVRCIGFKYYKGEKDELIDVETVVKSEKVIEQTMDIEKLRRITNPAGREAFDMLRDTLTGIDGLKEVLKKSSVSFQMRIGGRLKSVIGLFPWKDSLYVYIYPLNFQLRFDFEKFTKGLASILKKTEDELFTQTTKDISFHIRDVNTAKRINELLLETLKK